MTRWRRGLTVFAAERDGVPVLLHSQTYLEPVTRSRWDWPTIALALFTVGVLVGWAS